MESFQKHLKIGGEKLFAGGSGVQKMSPLLSPRPQNFHRTPSYLSKPFVSLELRSICPKYL